MMLASDLGKHGGVVLRPTTVGAERLAHGQELSAARVLAWPLRNRRALQALGRVKFYEAPPSDESASDDEPGGQAGAEGAPPKSGRAFPPARGRKQ